MLMELLLGLIIILLGAELFTNSVEWLGAKLGLSEGAVGSILAAVGTALPESIIPVVAILFSPDVNTTHIGIGAILGAPFMLGTLAFFIVGFSARCFPWRGPYVYNLKIDLQTVKRDLLVFIFLYSLALGASLTVNNLYHKVISLVLVVSYFFYTLRTFYSGKNLTSMDLRPLYFCLWRKPCMIIILIQVAVGLTAIVWGANYFVAGIKVLAESIGIPPLILAIIIAPIATELPEKFNSIIWIAQKKDTLALGNITGAMVFQSSIIPAFGMFFTPWQLNGTSLLSGILVLFSATLVLGNIVYKKRLSSTLLICCGFFYLIFIMVVFWGLS